MQSLPSDDVIRKGLEDGDKTGTRSLPHRVRATQHRLRAGRQRQSAVDAQPATAECRPKRHLPLTGSPTSKRPSRGRAASADDLSAGPGLLDDLPALWDAARRAQQREVLQILFGSGGLTADAVGKIRLRNLNAGVELPPCCAREEWPTRRGSEEWWAHQDSSPVGEVRRTGAGGPEGGWAHTTSEARSGGPTRIRTWDGPVMSRRL